MKLLLAGLLLVLVLGIQAHPPRNDHQHGEDHGKNVDGSAQGAVHRGHGGGGNPRVVRQVQNLVQQGGRHGHVRNGSTPSPGHNGRNPNGNRPNGPPGKP